MKDSTFRQGHPVRIAWLVVSVVLSVFAATSFAADQRGAAVKLKQIELPDLRIHAHFSPEQDQVLFEGPTAATAELYDLNTGKRVHVFKLGAGDSGRIVSLDISSNYVAVLREAGKVEAVVFDRKRGTMVRRFPVKNDNSTLTWLADGKHLKVDTFFEGTEGEGLTQTFELPGGALSAQRNFNPKDGTHGGLMGSTRSTLLITRGAKLVELDAVNHKVLHEYIMPEVPSWVTLSPDHKRALLPASQSPEGKLRWTWLWDLEAGREIARLPEVIESDAQFGPDSQRVVFQLLEELVVYETALGKVVARLPRPKNGEWKSRGFVNNETLELQGQTGESLEINHWNLTTGQITRRWVFAGPEASLLNHSINLKWWVVSANGKTTVWKDPSR